MAYLIVFAVGFIVGGLALMADIQRTEGRHARGDELMRKIDKAIEIIRGWSDEELRDFFIRNHCPYHLGIKKCAKCEGFEYDRYRCCTEGWNEEMK